MVEENSTSFPGWLLGLILMTVALSFIMSPGPEFVGTLVGLGIVGAIALWVHKNARERRLSKMAAQGWGIFTFLLLIIGLPAYLIARPKRTVDVRITPDTSSPTIPDKLRELAALRDEGVLSDEQFETKKAELLEQM